MPTIQCMLHEAGFISRQRPAIISGEDRIPYGELDLMVSGTAQWLRKAGIRPGERVALYMEPGWPYITLLFALIRVGAVACPMNTRLPLPVLVEHLAQMGCTKLIARVRDESRQALTGITCLDPDGLVSRALTAGQQADDFAIDSKSPATILFTAGSSGQPKAVLHSYGSHYYSALGANANVRLRSQDAWLVSLPLYHAGGLGIVFRCVASGAAMVFPAAEDAGSAILAKQSITHLSLVPTQLRRLLHAPPPHPAIQRLKAVLVGGAAAPLSLLQEARDRGLPVLTTYGLTEMNAQVTALAPHEPKEQLPTAGRLLKYRELRIDAGQILVRGSGLCEGYVEGPRVVPVVNAEGWYETGDIGFLDDDGYLHVTGRRDNMMISGGENIHPEEIERCLLAIPGVEQAMVVAVPDEEFGQRPVAFVDYQEEWTADHLAAVLSEHLPRFKIPSVFHAWPADLPEAMVGKPPRAYFSALAARASAC